MIDIDRVEEEVTQKINQLRKTLVNSSSSKTEDSSIEQFDQTMKSFQRMHKRFLQVLNHPESHTIQWEQVESPGEETVLPYQKIQSQFQSMSPDLIKQLLNKLVVLKLNGGLGTTMGCTGPKSIIKIRGQDSFLDLTIKQIEYLNNKYQVNIPLVLMNSFNTHDDTYKILPNYTRDRNIRVLTFNQKQFPRIHAETYLPIPETADPNVIDLADWYPPGHGDIYDSFYHSGLYEQLVNEEGKEIMFMSNVDNLGAVVDLNILNYLIGEKIDFCMEVTRKTLADVKGGTLIRYRLNEDDDTSSSTQMVLVKLLEIAQVPEKYLPEFKSIDKFKIFNTNNLWIRLKAIEERLEALTDSIEIINNRKEKDGIIPVIQMETAAGAAIQVFKKAIGIEVPRSRFLPVKTCSDLLLIQSNVYELTPDGSNQLMISEKRRNRRRRSQQQQEEEEEEQISTTNTVPIIELSDEFKNVNDFNSRFSSIPNMVDCESLIVSGDVKFGRNVTLKGHVKIVADKGKTVTIEDGQVLENTELKSNA